VVAAPLVVATCLLLARISAAAGGLLVSTRRSREALTVVTLLGIVCISPLIALLSSLDYGRDAPAAFERLAHVVAWTPLGAAWAAPGWVASRSPGGVLQLLDAAVFVGLLWLIWRSLVALTLVRPARQGRAQTFTGLGWFGRLPATPLGAIAARSLTYWARDVRYRVAFAMVPITPVLIIGPLLLVGVPPHLLALIPVPCVALFLGWMSHNDVAYDSTAVWLHVASGVRGRADRLGRAAPVLAIGVPLVVIGSVVCGVLYGDPLSAAGIAGVSGCLLLSGLGLSFVSSARFPYPVPRPGDSPFQQPNATTGLTAAVQSVTFFAQFLLALPAMLLAVLGLVGDPVWHLAALVAGLLLGGATYRIGLRLGSRVFERRGPEILAAAIRA
jgi:ABC-2 type transport system permease protein